MSGEAYPSAQEKHPDTCRLCGRMLSAGYYFVCHVCGATYCYSHMPERCTHASRNPMTPVRPISPKA